MNMKKRGKYTPLALELWPMFIRVRRCFRSYYLDEYVPYFYYVQLQKNQDNRFSDYSLSPVDKLPRKQ